jgi:hypothetical protein
MNIKQLLLVTGGIALSFSCLSIAPVKAQTGTTAPAPVERGWSKLNLSPDQQTQMQQIREETDTQIK